jgi:hypothetical protein
MSHVTESALVSATSSNEAKEKQPLLLIEWILASKETFSAKGCREGGICRTYLERKVAKKDCAAHKSLPFHFCSNTNMHSQECNLTKDPSLLILYAMLFTKATE